MRKLLATCLSSLCAVLVSSPAGAATCDSLRGLKLTDTVIIEHGWSDGTSSPLATVNYYKDVASTMGQNTTDGFLRLFMVPGMSHCGGPGLADQPTGPGPNRFREPMTRALVRWVESGVAPGPINATKYKYSKRRRAYTALVSVPANRGLQRQWKH